ncbi:hypothetical protein SHKM778_53500 [Streptomyces sp. KM77-8]|uniref:FUSC family protein n=1 Tax=Streptomyces haneummycinicus TaxID=3074435 RepID=A0AAT9HND6_9ACTN
MRVVREMTAPVARFVKLHRDPVTVQTVRSAAAATVAFAIATRLSPEAAPLTAPLTALLVVQVTLYSTLTTGMRRVNSVVTGVVVAILFSLLVGLTWWSLGLLILASLIIGHLVRVDEFVPEVAISAMLVLGVTTHGDTAWSRIVETLIGATVGMAFNLLLAPPVWVEEAGESIEELARRVRQLMLRIGEEAAGRTPRTGRQPGCTRHGGWTTTSSRWTRTSDRRRTACGSIRGSVRDCCTAWCCVPGWTRWRSARWYCGSSRARSPTCPRSARGSGCSIRRRAPRSRICCPRSRTPWSASRCW